MFWTVLEVMFDVAVILAAICLIFNVLAFLFDLITFEEKKNHEPDIADDESKLPL
jgi:hypothetical protein